MRFMFETCLLVFIFLFIVIIFKDDRALLDACKTELTSNHL